MAFYGVGIEVKVRELNLQFKLALQQKSGSVGIRSLARIFRRMDVNGNKKLDGAEFEQALAAFGYVLCVTNHCDLDFSPKRWSCKPS